MEAPRIISVDDHVLEPAHLWKTWLPEKFKDRAPYMERVKGLPEYDGGSFSFPESDDGYWADRWVYEDRTMPVTSGFVAASMDHVAAQNRATLTDEWLPGCTDQTARLHDMDINHVEASLCFPTMPRFCGQTFLEAKDKDLALACVQAYNDWMIEDWCGGDGHGRLIPLTLIPLWDPTLAAAEVERCAAKGSHAICFSESPTALGLPSIFTGDWDVLWHTCEATDTVVNMHIGSSSQFSRTSLDAPPSVAVTLTFEGSSHAFVDWVLSGVLTRFPDLRIALSEGQVGWMPFLMDRLDQAWKNAYGTVKEQLLDPPSTYVAGRIFGCMFDDIAGLAMRDTIGMGQIMFETDYPHADSTWPHSKETVEKLCETAGLNDDEMYALVRGNAISCYGLDKYFSIPS